jgi:hypothetical protein
MTQTTDPPADSTITRPRAWLETAAQDFDWTRQLDPDVRGLVTTWLEIGDRAIRTINIVAPAGGTR